MFKIDFRALNKIEFSNELNTKVLRELCAEARQRVWRQDSSFVFRVNGQDLKKPIHDPSKPNKRLSKKIVTSNEKS